MSLLIWTYLLYLAAMHAGNLLVLRASWARFHRMDQRVTKAG